MKNIFIKITVVVFCSLICISSCGPSIKNIRADAFNGRIISIFRQEDNKGAITYKIATNIDTTILHPFYWPYLYEYAKEGDSIVKLYDSLHITIIRNDTIRKRFELGK